MGTRRTPFLGVGWMTYVLQPMPIGRVCVQPQHVVIQCSLKSQPQILASNRAQK